MSQCEATRPAPLRCPTLLEILRSALQMLPRGRAWQSNEGGPISDIFRGFDPGGFDEVGFSTRERQGAILYRFWKAVAGAFYFVNQRLCDLRFEFWCATHKETHDLWMAEYGLPDPCDPFPDLCTKVAAIGGTRCEYYAEVAARAGWTIGCVDDVKLCGARVGFARCGNSKTVPGTFGQTTIAVIVNLNESPSYVAPTAAPAIAGRFLAGRRPVCDISLDPLRCILDRVVHAHISIIYQPS